MLRWCRDTVARVASFGPAMAELDDEALRALTPAFRDRFSHGETLDELLPEAFAAVREAAGRALGQRHYDVQIMGGAALHRDAIVEMRTGEGKTLTITLAAYLNALPGDGVHVLTASDFLAGRDAAWMRPVYSFLGMETGLLEPVTGKRDPALRRVQYAADITYASANEFCYDYLYDNLAEEPSGRVQRGRELAIVDEADLILLDEARLVLQVSADARDQENRYERAAVLAAGLEAGQDYEADPRAKTIALTESGMRRAEQEFRVANLYDTANLSLVRLTENALKAKEFYRRDRDYLVEDGRVVAIDQTSGRPAPDRRLADGDVQAVEAKEGVAISPGKRMIAGIATWDYLGLYQRLTGLTGTAVTDADAYRRIYPLGTVVIPTDKPMIRIDHPDVFFATKVLKLTALAEETTRLHQRGQPVLIGVTAVEEADLVSRRLEENGVPHEVLTARNHAREAQIMAKAGLPGAVTVVAQMAGRGVDIVLGGPDGEHRERVADLGGLCVLGAARPVSLRAELHLRGRAGRQGDPGESKFFVSIEDEILLGVSEKVRAMFGKQLNGVTMPMLSRQLGHVQAGYAARLLAALTDGIQYDAVLAEQYKIIRAERAEVFAATDLRAQTRATIEAAAVNKGGAELAVRVLRVYDRREAKLTPAVMRKVERRVTLRVIDRVWPQHLQAMNDALGSVTLRATTGGGPPLPGYQREAARLFEQTRALVRDTIVQVLLNEDIEKLKALS
jgi:preprotein translocase subunit SecA